MNWPQEPGPSSREALAGLREARRLLRRPAAPAMEACVPHLETAIRYLTSLESELRGRPAEDHGLVRGELQNIQRELRHVNALMENAGRFYSGLGQLLAAAGDSATYNPRGQVKTPAARPGLRLQG